MVVGQQTYEWGFDTNRKREMIKTNHVKELMDLYTKFDLGRNYTRSPWWQGCHEINQLINHTGLNNNFLWSNLIKVDERNKRPSVEIEDRICEMELLKEEIEITDPEVIIFFTGSYYDDRLKKTFPGLKFEGTKLKSRVIIPNQDRICFRTYHSGYLRRSKNWHVINVIAKEISHK